MKKNEVDLSMSEGFQMVSVDQAFTDAVQQGSQALAAHAQSAKIQPKRPPILRS